MRGEVHILLYCPIDTLQWGQTHSALQVKVYHHLYISTLSRQSFAQKHPGPVTFSSLLLGNMPMVSMSRQLVAIFEGFVTLVTYAILWVVLVFQFHVIIQVISMRKRFLTQHARQISSLLQKRSVFLKFFHFWHYCRTHRVPTYPWYFPSSPSSSSSSRPLSDYYYKCLIYHIQA